MDKCRYDGDAKGNRLYVENMMSHDLSTPANLDEVYAYDGLNCLASGIASIADSDAESTPAPDMTVTYKYDVSSNWIGETVTTYDSEGVGTVVENRGFVYDGDQIVLQFDKSGEGSLAATDLSQRYLWGPAVDQLLAQETPGAAVSGLMQAGPVAWALTDNQGTVRDLATYDPAANDGAARPRSIRTGSTARSAT